MYNSVITSDITFNIRSFAHFMFLRNSPHAQKEIKDIANEMWELVTKDESLKATWAVLEERQNYYRENHLKEIYQLNQI